MNRIKIIVLGCLCVANTYAKNNPDEPPSRDGDFTVEVRTAGGEWAQVPVYTWKVDQVVNGKHQAERTHVGMFDLTDTTEVTVTYHKGDIHTCRIRPLSYGVTPRVEGNRLTFTLDRSRYLSIEVNGDIFHNLQLFADEPIKKPKKDKNLIYLGPGVHRLDGDSLAIPSGKTVYIDKGAIVKGWLSVDHAENVRILGHGIVDAGHHEGIMIRNSHNILVDGTFTTQIPVGGSEYVTIRNAKVMSWYGWGDGFNVFASNHVTYQHIFARTSDDCSTIYCTRKGYQGGCEDITVRNAVYWADVAHPIMIGLHGNVEKNETIENVLYEDIDILDQAENQVDYMGCIGINDGDNNLVRNITFQNIRIEELRKGMLFNLRVCYNKKYCLAPGRGIENITFRNITYTGKQPVMSLIAGYDESRRVRNIRFEHLTINGTVISDDMERKPGWYKTSDFANMFIGEHVEHVTFSK